MTDEIALTENQRKCIPDVSFELIPIKDLVSNQDYQRELSEVHIRKALEEFDVYQLNPVKVSRRNGVNYVFDGQHTAEIVAAASCSRETPVWCMVYNDLDVVRIDWCFGDKIELIINNLAFYHSSPIIIWLSLNLPAISILY